MKHSAVDTKGVEARGTNPGWIGEHPYLDMSKGGANACQLNGHDMRPLVWKQGDESLLAG